MDNYLPPFTYIGIWSSYYNKGWDFIFTSRQFRSSGVQWLAYEPSKLEVSVRIWFAAQRHKSFLFALQQFTFNESITTRRFSFSIVRW